MSEREFIINAISNIYDSPEWSRQNIPDIADLILSTYHLVKKSECKVIERNGREFPCKCHGSHCSAIKCNECNIQKVIIVKYQVEG